MGAEYGIYYHCLFELNKKIESLIKNKSNSYIDQIVNEIASYFMSEKILYCDFLYKETGKDFEKFIPLLIVCESNERNLFKKCLFPLLVKLINLKFDEYLIKMNN